MFKRRAFGDLLMFLLVIILTGSMGGLIALMEGGGDFFDRLFGHLSNLS